MKLTSIQSGNGLTTYWFAQHGGYESYLRLDSDGKYVDGTFTADSKLTAKQIRVTKRNVPVK